MVSKTTTVQVTHLPRLAETKEFRVQLSNFSDIMFVEADPSADFLDQAAESTQRFNEYILETFQFDRIAQALHAHDRIQQGLGGICEDCGTCIPIDRLDILPNATRCVGCQTVFEKRRGLTR